MVVDWFDGRLEALDARVYLVRVDGLEVEGCDEGESACRSQFHRPFELALQVVNTVVMESRRRTSMASWNQGRTRQTPCFESASPDG